MYTNMYSIYSIYINIYTVNIYMHAPVPVSNNRFSLAQFPDNICPNSSFLKLVSVILPPVQYGVFFVL